MHPTLILLALVVVLGFVSEAGATSPEPARVNPDYTIDIGAMSYGIADFRYPNGEHVLTVAYLGPLGDREVPFTATQGLIGFCFIVVGMVALLTAFTFRWKRKAANRL